MSRHSSRPPRVSLCALLMVTASLTATACKDDAGGENAVLPIDAGPGTGGSAGADVSIITSGGTQGGNAGGGASGGSAGGSPTPVGGEGGGGTAGGDQPPPGGMVARDCEPGRQRCVQEGESTLEVCNNAGQWGLDVCPDGAPCYADRCLPSPADCAAGERICISETTPAVCNPGVSWTPEADCAAGEVCANGTCASQACALAALNRSYLGCDYWAAELPNSAFSALGGTTPDAPIGIVLVNPDEVETARLTVRGPNGDIAQLVGRVSITPPPPQSFDQPSFQPVTVQSEVRDADGRAVAERVETAEGLEVPPGGLATLLLPRVTQYDDNSQVGALAFRIQTDRPIAAYQFNPLCCNYSYSNDASLLIPASALGTDYRFLGVPAWSSPLGGGVEPTAMAIVGTKDATEVTVTLPRGARVAADRRNRVRQAGGVVSLTLDAHEVAVLQSTGGGFGQPGPDFSGAVITSTAEVGVFSSHRCTFYPEATPACDHVEEAIFPAGTLGRQYVLTPLAFRQRNPARTDVVFWKILSTTAGNRITLSVPFADLGAVAPGFAGVPNCRDFLEPDGQTLVLGENGYCEFGTQRSVALEADNLIQVLGIVVAQEAAAPGAQFGAHAGDPAIFMLPPDLQYRDDYAFLVPGTYENDWLTVVADADTALELDGQPVDLAGAEAVPGTTRVYKHITLGDGGHRIRGDKAFGIIVYAFDDYVSYAFTGGLNLQKR
jgi:hypothetical protein